LQDHLGSSEVPAILPADFGAGVAADGRQCAKTGRLSRKLVCDIPA
jgi:hypothetical protein